MEGCLRSVRSRAFNRNRGWLSAAALGLTALVLASPAGASVTIGQLAPGTPSADCWTPGIDYLQPSVTGGDLYVAKQAGTIISWSTNSAGSNATYVLKIFRRTTDPDSFQVMAHSPPHDLTTGLNTVPVSLHVESGDMIGLHETGLANSCTFSQVGDDVLDRTGDLADGASGLFAQQNDVRLNLSAVLVPDNTFSIGAITRDRKRGKATITVTTSNPGYVSVVGKGMKKRAPKSLAVSGPVTFSIASVGKAKHSLGRKRRVVLPLRVTFSPDAGEPSTQTLDLKLHKARPRTPSSSS